jgi:phage tail sheath protein FI
MSTYQVPGVFIEDVFPTPTTELLAGVPAFLGYAGKGAENEATLITNWLQFGDAFGSPQPHSYLAYAVRGFFENGGRLCYVVRLKGSETTVAAQALNQGLEAIVALDAIDLVCAPDIMREPRMPAVLMPSDLEAVRVMQSAVLDHCDNSGDRLAILDSLPVATNDDTSLKAVRQQRQGLSGLNGALYFPWVGLSDSDQSGAAIIKYVPPCGHIAGVYARTDARVGVHKAPANEGIMGVLDLAVDLSNAQQAPLNEDGINCLRAFPGRGLLVWGARTLSRDPNWTYVSTRRIFMTAGRWIERNMTGVAFEPNGPGLWGRIRRELTVYFNNLLQQGALKGSDAAEAFFIKCDAETNPAAVRDAGRVVTEIGLATAVPSEFIVVRIIHGSSGVTIEGSTGSIQ